MPGSLQSGLDDKDDFMLFGVLIVVMNLFKVDN